MPRYILETTEALDASHVARIMTAAHPYVLKLEPQAHTLHIVGRRWFQRTYGNTYHTVSVLIDGQLVHKSAKQYGYGDQYLTTAVEWLKSAGHIPQYADKGRSIGTFWLREESGFTFSYEVHDVPRERDL